MNIQRIHFSSIIAILVIALIPVSLHPGPSPRELSWDDLLELNLKTGKVGPKLRQARGKLVKLPGYMVALDDIGMDEEIGEFLFVPYAQACIHVPAPPPNQIVHARVKAGKKINYDMWRPYWVIGILKIDKSQSDLAEASFRMVVQGLEPYTLKDMEMEMGPEDPVLEY